MFIKNRMLNPKLKRALTSLIMISVLVYIGFGALLNIYQYNFIYFPSDEVFDDNYYYTAIHSDNEKLKLWVLNPDQKEAIIFFGGNASNAHRAISQFDGFTHDKTIYLVNYRGYGGSTGSPSEKGLYIDSLNIYDFVQDYHSSVSVIGRSLGTGIATYLAANRNLKKLVLVTPFDSIEAVAKERYPIYPISYLLHDKYDSISRVSDISEPTLILIADTDRVVPVKHAHKLANAFKAEQVTVEILPETNHTTISHHPRYPVLIDNFLARQ